MAKRSGPERSKVWLAQSRLAVPNGPPQRTECFDAPTLFPGDVDDFYTGLSDV